MKFKVLTTILDQLFAAISKFRINAINLQNEFSDYYERCRKYENKRKILQTGIDIDMDMEVPTFNQSNLIKEVGLIKETYNVAFKKFYQLIEQDSESRLAVLAFRLDFSEFYTHTYDHLKLY